MRIKCICIDDQNRPKEIPANKWVQKNKQYNITWIYKQKNQNNIQGCSLAEINIDDCAPYNCFRLTRFAILVDDLQKLIELMDSCTGMDKVRIGELIKELETVEELV